jgi:hypothetical protein
VCLLCVTIKFVGKGKRRKIEIRDFMRNNDIPFTFTAAETFFVYYKIRTAKTYGSLDTRPGMCNANCKLSLLEKERVL